MANFNPHFAKYFMYLILCHIIYIRSVIFVNIIRETGLKFLGDVASKQVFKPWEISDNIPRLKYELAGLSPYARLLDLLHRAAYRTGLGNSLFCPDYLVGSHSSESVSIN